jgi:tyrosyl-tRNA synthetase
MAKLSEELRARGLVQHHTFENLAWLDTPRTFYLGADCSSDSLTIGNLMTFLVARRLLDAGWKTILLVGGATSLIGDPGGKDSERELKSREEIQRNVAGIKKQVSQLFDGKTFELVDNYDWFKDIGYLDFLRDVGKHFSMTELVQREFVSTRMGEGGSGISYAEFSYSLIQGYDFWHLFREKDCIMQIGGSDQWGNMVSGLPLIRKKESKEAHAFSIPLLINKATGKKFGKSEEGALWLDPARTSPFKMYQFLFNSEDDAVEEYLLKLTLLPLNEIKEVMEAHDKERGARIAQRLLARHVTALVHGEEKASSADVVSNALFGSGDIGLLGEDERAALLAEAPNHSVQLGDNLVDVLVASGLASSKREAREFISGKAISLGGVYITDPAFAFGEGDFARNGLGLLRRGKRQVCVVVRS